MSTVGKCWTSWPFSEFFHGDLEGTPSGSNLVAGIRPLTWLLKHTLWAYVIVFFILAYIT